MNFECDDESTGFGLGEFFFFFLFGIWRMDILEGVGVIVYIG